MMHPPPAFLSALRHRDYRLLIASFAVTSVGIWAYGVALVAWIYDETGSPAWISLLTAARLVPALVLSSYGGVIAERFERVRLMTSTDAGYVVLACAMAALVAVDGPVVAVVALAAAMTALGTGYEPAAAALTPQLVGERDLASANTLRNTVDNLAVIVGPSVGAVVVFWGSPSVAVAFNAACFAASGLLLLRIRARSTPTDVTEGGRAGPMRQMLVGIRAIATSSSAAVLVGFSFVATLVFGIDSVLLLVLSTDVLGWGTAGYGYLLTGLGVGGLLAAPLVPRVERLPHLSVVIVAGMTAYCVPTLLFLLTSDPVVGFTAQVLRGAGTLFVDVLAVTALQRSLPSHLIARVFGAFETLLIAAVLVGAALAPLVLGTAGLPALLWLVGAGVPLVCLLGIPALRRADREATARRAALASRIELLRRCDLFADRSEGGLAQLAGAATDMSVAAGADVVVEGAESDALYVVVSGRLTAAARGDRPLATPLSDMGPGDYFGEIGLLQGIPRTATVTTAQPSTLLRIDAGAFLDALAEGVPSSTLLANATARLRRTHPTATLRADLSGDSGGT